MNSGEFNRGNPQAADVDEMDSSDDENGFGGGVEKELATRMLQIQSKRFYLDVKQNRRGRFIKIAEVSVAGRKSRLLLAMSSAREFRDHLTEFDRHYASLGPTNLEALPEDGKLMSEVIVKDNRRYYLDLKENNKGRFLRVSQTVTTQRSIPRSQIAIPAQGLIEFRDALDALLQEFGTEESGYQGPLPDCKILRVEDKTFYFDVGHNSRGIYVKISEVKNNFRTAITVPEKSWGRFRDVFVEMINEMTASRMNLRRLEEGVGPSRREPYDV